MNIFKHPPKWLSIFALFLFDLIIAIYKSLKLAPIILLYIILFVAVYDPDFIYEFARLLTKQENISSFAILLLSLLFLITCILISIFGSSEQNVGKKSKQDTTDKVKGELS